MKITLGTTYYNNPANLKQFLSLHLPWVDELIVVDDGSNKFPITEFCKPANNLRLFRVTKDLGFNSHGCRNLIMKQATNDWVILLDLDRIFLNPKESINIIKNTKLINNILYRFVVHNSMYDTHISVNDFLIHKNHFFSAGGYDEELIGIRTGDREYFEQLLHFGKEKLLHGVAIQFTRESTVLLSRERREIEMPRPTNNSYDFNLIHQRMLIPEPGKKILTFPWEEIT
jgi:glycosyltransferase involved in cell wall biosynthesis